MTNIKYKGNNTTATVYKIAPVNAKALFRINNPRALNYAARAVTIRCGATRAVAIPMPICPASESSPPKAPDQ